jgi:hypothetical protein
MGIVSITAVAAALGFLFALQRKINQVADREGDEDISWMLRWGARLAGLVAVLGIVGIVDSYIYELPNPLEKDGIELPAESTPELVKPVTIKKAEKPDPMKDAKKSHHEALDEFGKKPEKSE